MRHIQRVTEEDLLAVLYPTFDSGQVVYQSDNPELKTFAPFAERTFQPTAENFGLLGLSETSGVEEVEAAMQTHGFTGVTWDVGPHAQSFQNPLELCRRLSAAGLIRSVHLAVNRKDLVK